MSQPIALEAYEELAESYAAKIDTKPHNAYYERPATLSLLPSVTGKAVLDAGCGPGVYTEWLLANGAEVSAIDASPKMVELARKRIGDGEALLSAAAAATGVPASEICSPGKAPRVTHAKEALILCGHRLGSSLAELSRLTSLNISSVSRRLEAAAEDDDRRRVAELVAEDYNARRIARSQD
jgi:hypothetical protein